MKKLLVFTAVAVVCLLPAGASDPGEPLDCSDWVSVEPGFTCSYFQHMTSDLPTANRFVPLHWPMTSLPDPYNFIAEDAVDNAGNLLFLRIVWPSGAAGCHEGGAYENRLELVRFDGNVERIIGYIDMHCGTTNTADRIVWRVGHDCRSAWGEFTAYGRLIFDDKNGRVLIPVISECIKRANPGDCQYLPQAWIMEIGGFATAFEILQSYTPTSGPLSFRVPAIPEGMAAAEYFDTYYGTLATVGDWSQAQPMQCGYPASAPSVGDYLTVADTLPTPAGGQGYYYVTAVTYQGETRYGRNGAGGVLTGRDPVVLPACSQ
jgi:hypothetical protein